jgi:hypothetical protein
MPSEPAERVRSVMPTTVGVMHPGEMGGAIGACLVRSGTEVFWSSTGRSAATAWRASDAGLTDVGTVDRLAARCDVLLSVCPPHAATPLPRRFQSRKRRQPVRGHACRSPRDHRRAGGRVGAEDGLRRVDQGNRGTPPGDPRTGSGGTRRRRARDRVGDVPARSRRRATFADAGLPDGFHCAAAEVYRRAPRIAAADGVDLDRVIEAVRRPGGAGRT